MTVLVYVVIIAAKLARLERETAELAELAREARRRWLSCSSARRCSPTARRPFAYAGELRGPGLAGRLATWGVRLGWLAQTALLVGQAASADGFPWGTWAGALNLFVWLVVGAYLIWGCTPRYRLLGLDGDAGRGRAARARLGGRRHGAGRERPLRRRARGARRR